MMRETLLRLAALFSYCGGPLFIADVLKRRFGPGPAAFVITFLPVGAMVVGALCLGDDTGSRLSRAMVWVGRQGLSIALGMHAYAIWCFTHGVRTPDLILHDVGIAVGVVWSVAYLRAARRWASFPGGPSHEVDRASTGPIEPS
jgi:hypothetical protein